MHHSRHSTQHKETYRRCSPFETLFASWGQTVKKTLPTNVGELFSVSVSKLSSNTHIMPSLQPGPSVHQRKRKKFSPADIKNGISVRRAKKVRVQVQGSVHQDLKFHLPTLQVLITWAAGQDISSAQRLSLEKKLVPPCDHVSHTNMPFYVITHMPLYVIWREVCSLRHLAPCSSEVKLKHIRRR